MKRNSRETVFEKFWTLLCEIHLECARKSVEQVRNGQENQVIQEVSDFCTNSLNACGGERHVFLLMSVNAKLERRDY